MRKMGLGLLAGIAAIGMTDAAEAEWLRADTDNFIIYSESNEQSLRNFAESLQKFDTTLRIRFNLTDAREPNRLTIYLVPRGDDAGRLATGKSGSPIAGWYSPDSEGSFAVSHRENTMIQGTPLARQTLFHEYSHHFMKRYAGAAFPAWFIEGFAEYYSTLAFTRDGKAEIGRPVHSRAYGLLAMPKIPATTLLTQRPGEMRNSGQMDVYYGRAWLLTHMLYTDTARAGQLGRYFDAINRGEDADKAAVAAFGDLKQLDRDLNDYVKGRMTMRTTGAPIPISGTIRIAPLSPAEDALLPLQLERRSAGSDDVRLLAVRGQINALSAKYSGDAGVWFELASTEWSLSEDKRNIAMARAAVDKALAIDPKHVRANVLLGQILSAEVEAKDDAKPADWNAVRKPIALANRTNPDDPVPLYAYYRSFVDQGVRPPAIAVQGLARAFALAPENLNTRVTYAFALASEGKFDDALKLAKAVAFDPHDGGQGEQLLAQLEEMRGNAKGTSAADTAADE
jgi:hypothetical protein